MTAHTTEPSLADSPVTLSDELLDALIEAVVLLPGPRARSAVICRLVHEMCATVQWLEQHDTRSGRATQDELISVQRLASAAQDYRLRMAFGLRLAATENESELADGRDAARSGT